MKHEDIGRTSAVARDTGGTRIPRGAPFEDRIAKRSNGCWEWIGYINPDGYGRYLGRGAHRVSYELFVGPIPAIIYLRKQVYDGQG